MIVYNIRLFKLVNDDTVFNSKRLQDVIIIHPKI